jgi:two-component system sensor histidine kinase/response regulator
MTAHAMQTEIQRCLETGMNDCVTKPVDPDKLKSVITRWIKDPSDPLPAVSTDMARAGNEATVSVAESIPGIDVPAALKRLMGNRRLFDKLLHDFAVNNADLIVKIRSEIDRGDFEAAQHLVHTLKGTAGNLSMTEVFTISQGLETSLRQDHGQSAMSNLKDLEKALRQLLDSLASRTPEGQPAGLKTTGDTGTSPVDKAALKQLLQELDEQLSKNNLNALKTFDSLKHKLEASGSGQQIEQLEDRLSRLDFRKAREQLPEVARRILTEVNT